ncbi:structural protein [Paludibacter sp. 221]|uniref:structural protein n=1 Tax=Paludibacter sp. 221 TaxID=2302939 RepID=UPI0013D3D3F1|nr:structural protein [Paludibacter sp. 221]NDV47951.1 structural protein [Paludibacter sp. 221]
MDVNTLGDYPNIQKDSLGKRNNNPMNIRVSASNKWLGKVASDNDFEKFISMLFGLRAGIRLLKTYYNNGYCTISQIINRWAPYTENNTEGYISAVERGTGISRYTILTFTPEMYYPIVREMCYYESYYVPTAEEFTTAYLMV